jgi:hypothetical protein
VARGNTGDDRLENSLHSITYAHCVAFNSTPKVRYRLTNSMLIVFRPGETSY